MQLKTCVLLLFSVLGAGLSSQPVLAQVTSNQPTTVVNSTNPAGHIVLGGAQQGQNLFHSFSELDTRDGRFINFIANPTVTNVISRTTSNSTHIDGLITITSNGIDLAPGVNLFLLSPNGITLGPNTITNIDGAFVASTATGLSFADGVTFQADTAAAPLLSVSTPIGLQMGNAPASIQVQGLNSNSPGFGFNSLGRGQNVLLLGGDIDISGGSVNLVGGRLQLAGLGESGLISLDSRVGFLNATLPSESQRGDVIIRGGSTVLTSGPVEATSISAENLRLIESTNLLSGAIAGVPLPYKIGDINIDVAGTVELISGNIYNATDLGAVGNTGDINLRASSLLLSDGSQIGAIGRGVGDIGSLNVVVDERIVLDGKNSRPALLTGLYSLVETLAAGQGNGQVGNLNIETGTLELINGALVTTSTLGTGNAGSTNIDAESILVDGVNDFAGVASSISSSVESAAEGEGGSVDIEAANLTVSNGAAVFGRTQGEGNAGNITINVDELDVLNGGQIVTTSFTDGDAGDISVVARDRINLTGIDPTYSSRVAISSFNALGGEASGIYANTVSTSSGSGGNIAAQAPQFFLSDAAQISVSSQGTGGAGSMSLSATEQLQLDRATIQAESRGGSEGNLEIAAPLLLLLNNSRITTNATGIATGGNIDLNTQFIVGIDNSDIVARATQGAGGQISIDAMGLLGISVRPDLTPNSDINASSELGVDGTVAITNPDVNPDSGLVELPANLVDSSNQLTAGCGTSQNQFIATGRGGLPMSPNRDTDITRPWQDLREITALSSVQALPPAAAEIAPQQSAIVLQQSEEDGSFDEAGAWSVNNNNEVVLLASSNILNLGHATCLSR